MDTMELDELLFRDSIMVHSVPRAADETPASTGPADWRDPDLSAREVELCREVNLLRTDPATFAEMLIRRRKHFYTAADLAPGDPVQRNPNLREGKAAVLEAIEMLQAARAVPPIDWKDGIHLASQDIRKTIRHQTTTDPTTPEAVNNALYSYGEYQGRATQLVGFGYNNPKEILCHLLISDGEPTRRSREILLDPEFRFGGLALGEEQSGMCVFHFISEGYWAYGEDD